jgi:hypothetical protein
VDGDDGGRISWEEYGQADRQRFGTAAGHEKILGGGDGLVRRLLAVAVGGRKNAEYAAVNLVYEALAIGTRPSALLHKGSLEGESERDAEEEGYGSVSARVAAVTGQCGQQTETALATVVVEDGEGARTKAEGTR